MKKEWIIANPPSDRVAWIANYLGCSQVTARILAGRDIANPESIETFFADTFEKFDLFCSLADMEKAIERIITALKNDGKILVFGDYDADGITGTAILYEFLSKAGACVSTYIPHRIHEGYGLKPEHISKVIIPGGYDLVITVDCGIQSHEAIELAVHAGVDVIVTDHHSVMTVPKAFAAINPKRPDCSSGFDYLAGAGVAFFLVVCLRKRLRDSGYWQCPDRTEPNLMGLCELAAIGTVADIVPMKGINRVITRVGLNAMARSQRPGINALLQTAGVTKEHLTVEDIAFRLGPRINACGRMDHANVALDLLLEREISQSLLKARHIDALNTKRRSVESAMLGSIRAYLDQNPEILNGKTLVLKSAKWHKGVLGIVASRLVEEYFRPVILLTESNGLWTGSGRSIPGIDLYEALCACKDHLSAFGGHSSAAGLSIPHENIQNFMEAFEQYIESSTDESVFTPKLYVDAKVTFDMINKKLADEIASLDPFGPGNPEPLLAADNVKVVRSILLSGKHRKMSLHQSISGSIAPVEAIWFNVPPAATSRSYFNKIAFHLQWNNYNGQKNIQLVIKDVQFD